LLQRGFTEQGIQKLYTLLDIRGTNQEMIKQLRFLVSGNAFVEQGLKEIEFVLAMNAEANIQLDLSLARGLSYYTGCILEVAATAGSLKSSIGGGGRYDNLTGIFGMPNVSGVGISFGLDRIYDVMEDLQLFPTTLQGAATKVLVCCMDDASLVMGVDVLQQIRKAGIAAEIYPDVKKLGKQLDYANALHIPFAIIIGENERNSSTPLCKNLITGTQQPLSVPEIINAVHVHHS
jgi:histidyl-tRNA synthetase